MRGRIGVALLFVAAVVGASAVDAQETLRIDARYAGAYVYDRSRSAEVDRQVRNLIERYLENRVDPLTRMTVANRMRGQDLLAGLPIPQRVVISIDGDEVTTRLELREGEPRTVTSRAGYPTPYTAPGSDDSTVVTQLFRHGRFERVFGNGAPARRYFELFELDTTGRRLSLRVVFPASEDGFQVQVTLPYVRVDP